MQISAAELEQRLRRAIEVRRVLRRATTKLVAFGAELLRTRDAASSDDPRSR